MRDQVANNISGQVTPSRRDPVSSLNDASANSQSVELSIVMPCLNEAETLGSLHPKNSARPK